MRVYLLGAGASCGHDETLASAERPPITTGILAAAEDRGLLGDPNFSEVASALKVYLSTLQPEKADPRTLDVEGFLQWLEERFAQLTHTVGTERSETDWQQYQEAHRALSESYYLMFELFRTYTIPNPKSSGYRRLAELARTQPCALITLNYDCLAEWAFEQVGSHYFYAGVAQPRPQSIPVIKLHGSINWWNSFRGAIVLARASSFSDIVQFIHSNRAWLKKIDLIPIRQLPEISYGQLVRSNEDYSEPALIPPLARYKDYMKVNVYHDVWEQARAALQGCTEFTVIGCSIRPEDENLCNLLSTALRSDSRIVVVDRDCENVCARLKDLTGLGPGKTFPSFASYVESLNDWG